MKTKLKTLCVLFSILSLSMQAQSLLDKRVDELVDAMSTQEKLEQTYNVRASFGGTASNTRLGIPGFVMSDSPHGVRFTAESFGRTATAFPTGIAITATWDEDIAEKIGECMGIEFWSFGRHQILGPCLDLARDSRGGRTAESGGEDPYLAGHMAKAMVNGMQKYPVIATLKHFMGESKQYNRLKMDVIASHRWLMDYSGYNFRIAMQEAGPLSIMNSYNKINGDKAAESSLLMKTILRERWGFPFYAVSDWANIDDARKAFRAGTDICMGSSIYESDLPGLVANKFVSTDDLDRAVKNILRTKILSGMLDYFPEGKEENAKTQEITDLNILAAQKSIILLKNENKAGGLPILPLTKTGVKIAVVGPNAAAENLNCYGSSATNPPYAVSIKAGLEAKIGNSNIMYAEGCAVSGTSTSGFAAAKTIAAAADYVIFAGGLDGTLEGEGYGSGADRVGGSFELPAIQQALIKELAAVNPNIIVVLQSGGVCTLNDCLGSIKGLVYSFYAAQEAGRAIADVLFGDYNPAGRMPLTMPVRDEDFPSWEEDAFRKFEANRDGGYRWLDENNTAPRYAFGFGLSYTTFEYSNMMMPAQAAAGQPFQVSVDVKNTGARAGEEVVQVYTSAPGAKVWAAKKELKGFRRIALEPGETKTVTFNFSADDFYYWNTADARYDIENGTYTIRIGGSSCSLPLTGQINFKKEGSRPDLRITRVYTMPRYPLEGQKVSFYALVKNQGNASTTTKAPYNISFNIQGREAAAASRAGTIIAPGQVRLIASDGEWTADAAGKMTLTAQVSFADAAAEWSTDNNLYTMDYFEVFDRAQSSSALKNLAYMKSVTVSSETGKYTGTQMVDGDMTTWWTTQKSTGESAVVDLEALCEIENIKLYWGDGSQSGAAKQYAFDKSLDGIEWDEIKSIADGAGSIESHDFEKLETRYLRIRYIEPQAGAGRYSLREMKVFGREKQKMAGAKIILPAKTVLLPHGKTYLDGTPSTSPGGDGLSYQWEQLSGPAQAVIISPELSLTELVFHTAGTYLFRLTVSDGTSTGIKEVSVEAAYPSAAHDLALKKPASASSSEYITMYPSAAVDGNDNTRWSSLHRNGEWWMVDLLNQVEPSNIKIHWHREYAKNFTIEISRDGTTWYTYGSHSSFTGGTSNTPNSDGRTGRYVRVTSTERNGQWESSFFNFSLYGRYVTDTNNLPQAKAAYGKESSAIKLNADGSTDADGDALAYKWEQITGPVQVEIENAGPAQASISPAKKGDYYFKLTVDDGKDTDFTILHVKVEEDKNEMPQSAIQDDIKVYPNPVKDMLYVQDAAEHGADRAEIYSMLGTRLTSKRINSGGISLAELPEGIYFLRLLSKDKLRGTMKIIKE